MKINTPLIKTHTDFTELYYSVALKDCPKTLWFRVAKEYASFLSALLIPAMQAKEDIYIEGALSEALYHHASGVLQQLIIIMEIRLSLTGLHIYCTITWVLMVVKVQNFFCNDFHIFKSRQKKSGFLLLALIPILMIFIV